MRANATTAAAHHSKLRSQPGPKLPRRVSGPLRPGREPDATERTRLDPRATTPSAGRRAAAFVRSLPDHRLIDRLVRGRAWIPVLGVMLAGIVAMQVEVLKLGASIGRSIQAGSTLLTRNEQLQANVASLADDQRIEQLAAGMGMIMPAPASVGFLSAAPRGDAQRAIANIHAPNATSFLSAQTSNGAVVTTNTLSPTSGSIPASAENASATGTPGTAVATGPTAQTQPTPTTQSTTGSSGG